MKRGQVVWVESRGLIYILYFYVYTDYKGGMNR